MNWQLARLHPRVAYYAGEAFACLVLVVAPIYILFMF